MMPLGMFCVVAGIGTVVGSLWVPPYRRTFEVMGGGLFLVGLGFVGADLALVS